MFYKNKNLYTYRGSCLFKVTEQDLLEVEKKFENIEFIQEEINRAKTDLLEEEFLLFYPVEFFNWRVHLCSSKQLKSLRINRIIEVFLIRNNKLKG